MQRLAARADPGIVDQDVRHAQLVPGAPEQFLHGLGVAHVRLHASVVWPSQRQAGTAATRRSACQLQGSNRASSCALVRPETMRSSTSVVHAWVSSDEAFYERERVYKKWLILRG